MSRIKRVRPILQMEMTECGAASLAMILNYYGKKVTLEEMRLDCGVSRDGVNAKNIVLAARRHHLETKAVRTEIEDISDTQLPAIIHWNMDHFVVLCGFSKRGAIIVDPESGTRFVSANEFSKSFTGIAIILKPDDEFKKENKKKRVKQYISECIVEFVPNIIQLILIELCMLIGTFILMFVNAVFIDRILVAGNMQELSSVIYIVFFAGILCVAVLGMREDFFWRVGKALNIKINAGVIEKLLKLPIEFFENRNEGELVNRQIANMRMGNGISRLLFPMPTYILQSVIYLILFFIMDSRIAWIAVVCAGLNIVAMIFNARSNSAKMKVYHRDLGMLEGHISRSVDIIETIKASGAEEAVYSRLAAKGAQTLNSKMAIDKTNALSESMFLFFEQICRAMILIAGVWEIINGYMLSGMLVASQAIATGMMIPLGNMTRTGIALHSLKGDIDRTDDIMHYGSDSIFSGESQQTGNIDGDIVLKDVSFSHNIVDKAVVKNIDMTIERGSTVAICGSSGCGKSTIARLIAGLYEEVDGAVLYNGLKKSEINRIYFYSKVAMVTQKIRLFEGTVAENIAMWDDTMNYEDIVRAAKIACIHEDIISLQGNYNSHVVENGKNFSGGQRQRIEIARALAYRPSILILDEATAALDAKTEAKILKNIRDLNITTIIIAHRLSAVRDCDRIYVVDKGVIAEQGTHDELIEKQGIYFELTRNDQA